MLSKKQVLEAVEGAEKLGAALGKSASEVLRKAMATERDSPTPAGRALLVMRRSA